MTTTERARRTREQRLRYQARLQGIEFRRSHRQLRNAPDWGRYFLDPNGGLPQRPSGPEYTLTLDDVERIITGTTEP